MGRAPLSPRRSTVNDRPRLSPNATRWLPAAAAAGLLGTVVLAGVALGGGGGHDPATPAEGAAFADDGFTLTVPDSVPPAVEDVETSVPIQKTILDRTLVKGLAGEDVREVQERLAELGFVPGPADGVYGEQTIKSVWAYEKLVMGVASNSPTGQVTPEMWDRMQDEIKINPRRPNSTTNHTEVYLPEQVLIVFEDNEPAMITHMASGDNTEWCEEVTISPGEYGNRDGEEDLVRGECGRSITPGGVFTYYRQVEGLRQSALGGMWNPVYFNYGIAIHGALNVPLQPASHGCIRIPLSISENLQDLIGMGDQVFVWDGVKEPEEYGEQLPVFNWLDPDYETTTTSTSTTTTAPPPTTDPPPTAPPPTAPPPTAAPPTAPPPTDPPATDPPTTDSSGDG